MGEGEKKKKERAPWYRSRWVKRLAVLVAAAAVGASCELLPEIAQPACAAIAKVLHAAGVP